MNPSVSLVLRTFNRRDRIARAIASARAQDYANARIIVVDDGSTDGTREMLQGVAGIEYHWQPNQGTSGAMKTGIGLASGELIAFLDSDDEWDPNYLSCSIALLAQHPQAAFVFSNYRCLHAEGGAETRSHFDDTKILAREVGRQGATGFLPPDLARELFVRYMPAPSSSLVLRRKWVLGAWSGNPIAAEDWMLVLEVLLSSCAGAAFHAGPLWTKWIHGANLADFNPDDEGVCARHARNRALMMENFPLSGPEKAFIRQEVSDQLFDAAYALARQGRLVKALGWYMRSFALSPARKTLLAIVKTPGHALARLLRPTS